MPQSDLIVENQTFASFRADLNGALAALGTNQSGATEPGTIYANEFWADTTANLLKLRNTGNTAWNSVGRLNQPWWGILPSDIGALQASNNLSDVANAATARANLGVFTTSKNHIHNGSFSVAQRATSFNFAASVNTIDRWNWAQDSGGGTAATGTVSRQTLTPGLISESTQGSYARITNTTIGSSLGVSSLAKLQQYIENVYLFAGKTVTLSFWARSTIAAKTVGIGLFQHFGSGGSAATSTNGQTVNLTTTWTKYSKTFSIPSISGKTIGTGGTALVAQFIFQAGSNNNTVAGGTFGWEGTGDTEITGVQLEEGSIATEFEYESPAITVAKCVRYFYTWVAHFVYAGVTGAFTSHHIKHPMPMRATPSITRASSSYTNGSFLSFSNVNSNSFNYNVTTTSGASTVTATETISAEADFT